MKKNPLAGNFFYTLAMLMILLSACVPQEGASPESTSPAVDLAPGSSLAESIEDMPTRTPVPTPTPGPIDRAVSVLLESTEAADQIFLGLTVEEWVNLGLSILIFGLVYIIILWLIRTPLRWLVRRTPTDFDDKFLAKVQTQIKVLVALLCLDFALSRLSIFSEGFRQLLGDIFFILTLVILFYFLWRLVLFTSQWYREKLVEKYSEKQYDTLEPLFLRLAQVVLLIFGVALLLDHFGFEISAITIIAILLLIAYFAARDVLMDAINGFVIMVDQPFRVGDRIQTRGMDTWGDVVDIGTRTTRMHTYDNRLIVIPNSDIANQALDNFTYPDPTYRMQLDIGIKYGTDVKRLQKTISEAVSSVEGVLKEKPVEVLLIEFGDSGLIFRVRWWVVTQTDSYLMSDRVNLAMMDALRDAEIEISFTTFNVINLETGSDDAQQLSIPTMRADRN